MCFILSSDLTFEKEISMKLEKLFETLGWPIGLVVVVSAILNLFGVSLDNVLLIAGSMLGLQLLVSLVVDVLKWAGVVKDGDSGRWSAGFNLFSIAGIAVTIALKPDFDFTSLDTNLVVIAQFATLLFSYIVQIVGSKKLHQFTTQVIGIKVFSHAAKPAG